MYLSLFLDHGGAAERTVSIFWNRIMLQDGVGIVNPTKMIGWSGLEQAAGGKCKRKRDRPPSGRPERVVSRCTRALGTRAPTPKPLYGRGVGATPAEICREALNPKP